MALPDIPEIQEILSQIKLSVKKPSDQDTAIEIPCPPSVDETGQVTQPAPLWLHYPAATKMPFRSLLEKISRNLEIAGHSGSNDFALFVIWMAFLIPPRQESRVSRVNRIIAAVCDADVNLYYILPIQFPEYYKFEIPPFRLGHLRSDKLKYNCEKALSDYYSRWEAMVRHSWAIERAPLGVRVLDVSQIQESIFGGQANIVNREPWEFKAWESIVNGYFSLQNRKLFDDFLEELTLAQTPLLALGAPFYDPRPLASFTRHLQVAVFLNIGSDRKGFVAPAGSDPSTLMVDVVGTHERIPNAVRELSESYGFQGFDGSPLHRSIKVFADFVARARRHEIDGRTNEALLHFVIALELIFAESQTIQSSVVERVALITFRENSKSFGEQRRWVKSIYELRSSYVHSGADITDRLQVDQLRSVCEQVFKCLMRLQAAYPQPQARDEAVLKSWLKELDYIAKGIIAGKDPTETQLQDAFIV